MFEVGGGIKRSEFGFCTWAEVDFFRRRLLIEAIASVECKHHSQSSSTTANLFA